MPEAQGISKQLAFKVQAALNSAASGSGGQLLRRRTSVFQRTRDTYENDEIASHQQSTGATAGINRVSGSISALLSALTCSVPFANLMRKDFAATTAITGLSVTIAGAGPTYTLTRAAGDFLTGGIKAGDVVRLTAGTFNAANLNKSLLVISLTATVLTVRPVNGVALVAEGPIAAAAVTVPGKKCLVPTTGHTNTFLTFEEWFSDISRSEVFVDCKIAQAAVNIPATGNAEVTFDVVGLSRVTSGTRVLTSPTAETATGVVQGVSGGVIVNGALTAMTSLQLTINGNVTPSDAELGSNFASDLQRGRIMVSGTFTAKFTDTTLQALFEAQTPVSIVAVIAESNAAASDFVSFNMSRVKIFSDTPDDGEKSIVRTYAFTAEINGAGGAALANDNTILTIQDSAA